MQSIAHSETAQCRITQDRSHRLLSCVLTKEIQQGTLKYLPFIATKTNPKTNLRVFSHIFRELPVPLTGFTNTSSRRPGPVATFPVEPIRSTQLPYLPSPPAALAAGGGSACCFDCGVLAVALRMSLIAVAQVSAVLLSDASHFRCAGRRCLPQMLERAECRRPGVRGGQHRDFDTDPLCYFANNFEHNRRNVLCPIVHPIVHPILLLVLSQFTPLIL